METNAIPAEVAEVLRKWGFKPMLGGSAAYCAASEDLRGWAVLAAEWDNGVWAYVTPPDEGGHAFLYLEAGEWSTDFELEDAQDVRAAMEECRNRASEHGRDMYLARL